MAKTIAVVGAGCVGQTLARGWRQRRYRIGAVVTRNLRSARAAARFIGAGKPREHLDSEAAMADIVVIAVPDPRVAETARKLARVRSHWGGTVVLHTSGVLSSRALGSLRRKGAAVGSLHPLYPFPRPLKGFPRGVAFGIEGDRRARKAAGALARALGGVPIPITGKAKTLYHAAAVLAAGHVMTLFDLGVRALVRAGVPRTIAPRALLPLAHDTLRAYARWGKRAWTGPLQRGDAETVRHHLVALRRLPRLHHHVYVALARAGLASYRTRRGRAEKELRHLLQQ